MNAGAVAGFLSQNPVIAVFFVHMEQFPVLRYRKTKNVAED
jgi:hypothetical protein